MVSCSNEELGSIFTEIQEDLFALGAQLATPPNQNGDALAEPQRICEAQVSRLENNIDQLWAPLEPMRYFILPGGGELSARLHVARAVCRRAERNCLALSRKAPIGPDLQIYLNRLSDLLFAAARRANQLDGVPDIPWRP